MKAAQFLLPSCDNTQLMTLSIQVNNMKAKFKETLERCDNLEQRVSEITKDKQSLEKK